MSLLEDREKTHGRFDVVAEISQSFKRIIQGYLEDERELEALEMIALKMARILAGNHKHAEHWLDIIGYAKLGMGWTSSGDPLDKKTE